MIKSHLTGRKQSEKLKNVNSTYKNVNIGVPQGTILGTLLFILYVNGLLVDMPDNTVVSYADDTAVMSTGKTRDDAIKQINKYLKITADWLDLNKLFLNIDKTVLITFGSYSDSVSKIVEIKIKDKFLNRLESYKSLLF